MRANGRRLRAPVHVLHVIHRLGDGGADHALVRLVNGSNVARTQHTVLALGPGPGYEMLGRGVRLIEAPLGTDVFEILPALKDASFDLVHGWVAHASIVAAALAATWGIPLVLRQPTNMEMELRCEPAQSLTYWPELKRAYQAADVVVVPSSAVVESTRRVCGIPTPIVIPNAIEASPKGTTPSRAAGRPLTMAMVGRLSPQKDPLTVIEALGHLAPDLDWRLKVFGIGNLQAACAARAELLGIADRVDFRGFDRSWAASDSGIDVFVTATRYEGMSNAILEAAAAGIPIVATAIPENEAILRHRLDALLVRPGHAEEMARALTRLARHPRFATQLGRRARARVRRFSITRMIGAHQSLYEALARARPVLRAA